MRWLLILLALCGPARADDMLLLGVGGQKKAVAAGYSGPGDAVPGWTAWWGLRAYSAAYAAAHGNLAIIRAATGANAGTTTTITALSSGAFDQTTAHTFGGVDATGTGTITGTTLTFTGGTIGDQVTGSTVLAGTAIISGASPTWTVNLTQTVASATLTLNGALFVTQMYDETGSGLNIANATAAQQPILVLNARGPGATLPALYSPGTRNLSTTSYAGSSQPTSWSMVAERNPSSTSLSTVISSALTGGNQQQGFANAANAVYFYATNIVSETAADAVMHAVQFGVNSTTSSMNVDGTQFTGLNPGTNNNGNGLGILGGWQSTGNPTTGFYEEGGLLAGTALSPTQQGSMHTNESAYWGTP